MRLARLPSMHQVSDKQFLINESYPTLVAFASVTLRENNLEINRKYIEAFTKAEAFRAELENMAPDEINALFAAAKDRNAKFFRTNLPNKDNELFFDKPNVNADFGYWAKISHWSLEEAVSLSFGFDPRAVSWAQVATYINI